MSSELSQSSRTNLTPDTWRASGDRSLVGQLKAGWKNISRAVSVDARQHQTLAAKTGVDTAGYDAFQNKEKKNDITTAVKAYADAASLYLQADARPLWWRSAPKSERPYSEYDKRLLQEPHLMTGELMRTFTDTSNLFMLTLVYEQVLSTQKPNGEPNGIDIAQRKVLIRILPDIMSQLRSKLELGDIQNKDPQKAEEWQKEKQLIESVKAKLEEQLAAVVSGGKTGEFNSYANFNKDKAPNLRDYQETVDLALKTLLQINEFKAGQVMVQYLNNPDLTLAQKKMILAEAPLQLGTLRDVMNSWSSRPPEPALLQSFLQRLKADNVNTVTFHADDWVPNGHKQYSAREYSREVRETTEWQRTHVVEQLMAIPLAGNQENARLILEIWANSFGDGKYRTVDISTLDFSKASPGIILELSRFAKGKRRVEERNRPGETVPNLNEKQNWELHDALQNALISYGDYNPYANFGPADQERVIALLHELGKLRRSLQQIPAEKTMYGNQPFRAIRLAGAITRQGQQGATSKWYRRVEKNVTSLNEDARRRNEKARAQRAA